MNFWWPWMHQNNTSSFVVSSVFDLRILFLLYNIIFWEQYCNLTNIINTGSTALMWQQPRRLPLTKREEADEVDAKRHQRDAGAGHNRAFCQSVVITNCACVKGEWSDWGVPSWSCHQKQYFLFRRDVNKEYLGHVVNGKGHSPDPEKIQVVTTWPHQGKIQAVKTLGSMKERFYWVHYRHDLQEWCHKCCDVCLRERATETAGSI